VRTRDIAKLSATHDSLRPSSREFRQYEESAINMSGFMDAAQRGEIRSRRSFRNQKQFYVCARKIRHADLWSAMLHIRGLVRTRTCYPGFNLAIYPCRHCDGLHVGKTRVFRHELAEGQFEFARDGNGYLVAGEDAAKRET
jgi:hypothetical protein